MECLNFGTLKQKEEMKLFDMKVLYICAVYADVAFVEAFTEFDQILQLLCQ